MNLFILRWNPTISSYTTEDHLNLISHIKNNEQPSAFDWSIYEYEKLQRNDMFILQQVGTEHDGIAMIGKFKDSCYEDESWREDGTNQFYADMWIMDAFDCDSENPLPADRYEQLFPQIKWHGGHSGEVVEEDLDDRLVLQIEKDLIDAGIWKEGELKKFMTWDFEKEVKGSRLITAKSEFLKNKSKEKFTNLICCLLETKVLMPMQIKKDEKGGKNYFPMYLYNDEKKKFYPIFSREDQIDENFSGADCEYYDISTQLAVDLVNSDEEADGLVLDPFTEPFFIEREVAKLIPELQFKD